MANINNIKTGNVNIPGALHSTANDGGGQVGNVVAYAGDIYDTTAGKNQATLNAEFAEGIANAGTGTGTITGATVGGVAVTEVSGVLQFQAYPTVPIEHVKMEGEQNDLTITNKRVVIPQPQVKGIKTNGGSDLTPNNGIVTLPPIPADPSSRLTNIENTLQQIANAEPIVIPSSAVELPTSANSTITYDSDDTYVMNISGTQIATVHYPYEHSTNSYLAFKAIDRDLYYVYQLTNAANNTYTFVEQHTYDELSHAEAKAVFEAGKYAVKQVIDVRHNGNPLPDNYFKHGIPSVFVTPDGYPLRYNQIKEDNIYYILLKCDENNKIFKYSASNGKWSLVSGGCYTKDDATTGENYKKYDVYFDRQPASNVSFDDSVAHLGTTLTPVDTVQKAINIIAVGVAGNIGKLIIKLLYPNSTPVTDKEVSITAYYRGNSFDLSPQYTPDFSGFKTDSNGYVVNADGGEFISLPLGATYTIHYTDISDSYLTPEDTTGVVDSSEKTISNIYQNVSENEFVYFYVQMPNVSPSVVTPVNKVINVDTYSTPTTHALAYKCVLRENGTVKQILYADGTTQATYNGEPLISVNNPVLLPIPTGTKYLSSLQLWDPTLSENEQRYVKSSDIIYTASKAKRTVKFEYLDNQVGIFLIVADATTAKGYRACLVTSIDTANSKILFKDGDYTYEAYLSNSVLYRKLENDVASEVWEETILGYGIKTSTTILNTNDDSATSSEYPNCSFIMPKNATTLKGALSSTNISINIPVNFGGLFVSNCYNELSGDTSSPLINRLLNNGEEAWSLTTSGGTKTIKGFAATLNQLNTVKGVISQVSNINNILFGTTYTYVKTGVTAVHPITLVTNNGSDPTSTGSEVANLVASTLNASNPRSMNIANTSLNIVVLYPFS